MDWNQLLGAGAAVLALGGIAYWLKLGDNRIADAETACRMAEAMLVGFVARRAIVSQDRRIALVAGNGTIAVLRRQGTRVAARRLIPPLRLRDAIEGVTVDTGERMFGPITLLGVLRAEVERLEAPLTMV